MFLGWLVVSCVVFTLRCSADEHRTGTGVTGGSTSSVNGRVGGSGTGGTGHEGGGIDGGTSDSGSSSGTGGNQGEVTGSDGGADVRGKTDADAFKDGGTDGSADSSIDVSTDGASADAEGLLGLSEVCTSDAQCLSGICRAVLTADTMHCTAFCDVGDPTCPEMGVCEIPGAAAGFCVRACNPAMDDCPGTLTCRGAIEPRCLP